jgi:hypothetical protein
VNIIIFSHNSSTINTDLSISIDTHKYLVAQNPTLIMPKENVKRSVSPTIKFLGVLFDPALWFKPHVNITLSEVSEALYILRSA